MNLVDIVYLDQKRLDSYVEQTIGPVTYDKVPVWKVALDIKGPSVEGAQTRVSRYLSVREKLGAVIQALETAGELGRKRLPLEASPRRREGAVFRLERVTASRIRIPLPVDGSLFMWYAPPPAPDHPGFGNPGPLYVLEDARASDEIGYTSISSYSTLWGLVKNLSVGRDEKDRLARQDALRALLVESHGFDEDSFSRRMFNDPVDAIASLGGTAYPSRIVDIFYRVRHTFMPSEPGNFPTSTFAYAIAIAAPEM